MGIHIVKLEKTWNPFLRSKTCYRLVEMSMRIICFGKTCLSIKLNSVNNGKLLLLKTTTRLIETVSGRLLLRRDGNSLRKQPTFRDTTTGFPAKWRRNERRNSILMTRHYPDLVSISDWLCREENLLRPTICTYQIWAVTLHQYGISVLVSQTSFRGETSGGVAKC